MKKYLTNDWKKILTEEFKKDYFVTLEKFIDKERKEKTVYPEAKDVFQAYNLSSYDETKVVIIGQDPYHQPNQAHGLAFSVKKGVKIPPSLKNIYKALDYDLNITAPEHGYLKEWATQGVLMINAVLTVVENHANAHENIGWENFTKAVIQKLNTKETPVVFILWGNYAQKFESYISNDRHKIIKSYHPSPLSAWRGFIESRPFSKCNTFLEENDMKKINWKLSP